MPHLWTFTGELAILGKARPTAKNEQLVWELLECPYNEPQCVICKKCLYGFKLMEFLIHTVNEILITEKATDGCLKSQNDLLPGRRSARNRKSSVVYVSTIEIIRKKQLNMLIDLLLHSRICSRACEYDNPAGCKVLSGVSQCFLKSSSSKVIQIYKTQSFHLQES